MMLNDLPAGLKQYSQTPVFTEKTVPAKLTADHNTKPGVWGKLKVIDGALRYVIPGPPEQTKPVRAGEHAIIEPTVLHFIELGGPVSFRVEFYRAVASAMRT